VSITVDIVHDEEVIDAVIDQLEANLPAAWLDPLNPIMGLTRIEFGSLRNWRFNGRDGDESPIDLCPCILCRAATSDENGEFDAIGGKTAAAIQVAVVHLFSDDQSYDLTNTGRPIQPERAKAQRANVISEAIYTHATDANRRRLGDPTISTTDTSAYIISVVPMGVDYRPEEDGGGIYAVAVNLRVNYRTT